MKSKGFPLVALMIAGLAGAGWASLAWAQDDATDQQARIDWGRSLYLENCAACHGTGAKGNGPLADDLKVPPSNLTTMAERRGGKLNGAEIREIIDGRKAVASHGTRDMPVWGSEFARARKKGEGREAAARNRVHAMVAYLESIQASR
ncbi:MAG: c-type cytochrome [Deltaproteobacteria bacterium]|nr:c-type cytochrome [Deltaproteobacteria bacterium]